MADYSNIDPVLLALQPIPVASSHGTVDERKDEQAAQTAGEEENSTGPFGIPNDVVEWLLQQPYDISWPQKWGVEHATLESMFKLPYHKFEALYRHGVLMKGDELCGTCLYSRGGIENHLDMVAKIVGDVRLPNSTLRPHVKIMWHDQCWAELPACLGPVQIAQTFEGIVRQDTGSHVTHNAFKSWHHLCLRRNAVYLGTLYEIRIAFSVWRLEMDSWAKTHGVKYRQTKGEKRKRSSETVDQETPAARLSPVKVHARFQLRTTSVVVHDRWALNQTHHHLSPADLPTLYSSHYDIEWMEKYRIDPDVLKTFTAKHKMENILLHGAMVTEDGFYIFDKE
ncbi:MAG: hypothetical protein LQ350_001855 [Teloschistes chrysophthalmus]|nr:MAG: hypothetical protein LQ350_001855 [Niorma chrysophthalma]